MKTLLLMLVFANSIFAWGVQDNPFTIWCDYHGTYLVKTGQEYPSGVCYDVYTHTYWDIGCDCQRTHKATMKCPKL